MTQLLRPIADISAGSWTASSGSSLFAMVDEVTASGTDYIRSPDNPTTQAVELKYGPGVGTHSSCTTRAQLQARGGTTEFVLELLQGATVLDTWSELVTVAEGLVIRTHVSTGISITDATDLRPRVTAREEATLRRLALHCTLPAFTPSEAQPFDLDSCTINNGDDITELLTDIQAQWPAGFYVRAPSKTVSVISDTILFPEATKTYMFLEDEDADNLMTIQHAASPADFWVMWNFTNFDTVKIGGDNLALTFVGNHPGLANCDVQTPLLLALGYDAGQAANGDANKGLLEFRMDDGTLATLADVRVNTRFCQHYSIYTWGSFVEGGVTDKINQFNVSGLHYATSGIMFHQGVKHVWSDPDNFVVSDPYCRGSGWTGIAPGPTEGGLLIGCTDSSKDQPRTHGIYTLWTDSLTGGVTYEYGYLHWQQRGTGTVGVSAADPYIVRIKDWNVSGPGTAYPAGVRPKGYMESIFMKGDPHDAGGTGAQRFVHYVKLADDYGSGRATVSLSGCTPACEFSDGASNFVRLENSVTGRTNRGWYVIFSGDWNTNFIRGDLFRFAFDETSSGTRSYGHTLEAASGTTITDLITMYDTDTVKGAGTFTNLRISNYNTLTIGRDNLITATTVAGVITIDASTGTTTISSVTFTGAARAVITVGAGSTAVVSAITAPGGSTITGAGSLTYNGAGVAMPYAI